jgi:hypothetical protein
MAVLPIRIAKEAYGLARRNFPGNLEGEAE